MQENSVDQDWEGCGEGIRRWGQGRGGEGSSVIKRTTFHHLSLLLLFFFFFFFLKASNCNHHWPPLSQTVKVDGSTTTKTEDFTELTEETASAQSRPFRYPFHPRVTAVARKRSRSFCETCRW